MAPEQVRGEAVDRRADIFALGAVLYEMLAGSRPFTGDSTLATLDAVLTRQPPDLSDVNPEISPALSQIVRRCLAKSPDDRFATVADVVAALDSVIQARNPTPPPSLLTVFRRPVVRVIAVLVILAIAAGGWRWSRVRWARTIAAPEVQRLSDHGDNAEAFLLVRQARDVLPDDRHLWQLLLDVSLPAVLTTDPAGADVAFAAYQSTHNLGSSRHDAAQRRPHSTRPHPRADFQGRFSADRGLRMRAFAALHAGSRGRGAAGHGARRRRPRSGSVWPGRC